MPIRSPIPRDRGLRLTGPGLLPALLLLACALPVAAASQSGTGCSKPRVYVRVAFVKGVEEELNRDYGFNTDQGWLDSISAKVIRELRLRGGDVELVPLEKAVFIDDRPDTPEKENLFNESPGGEYHLDFILGLAYTRNRDGVRDPSLRSSYWSMASIGDADIDGRYAAIEHFEYPDLDASINRVLSRLCAGGLRRVLDEYEATHFFSLREPRLTLETLAPGFVSPEPEDQRLRVRLATRDCRDSSGSGTNVWFPKEDRRGAIKPIFHSWERNLGDRWRAQTGGDGALGAEYRLLRGDEATQGSIEMEVAGRGQKRIRQAVRFGVKTLRVEVAPDRQGIAPGETTRIVVRLFKVDEGGRKETVGGRTLTLKVSGLVDGSLKPRDTVTLDQNGTGTLTYTAGGRDGRVRIEASYTPQNYETTFRGEAELSPNRYTVTVDLEFSSPYVPDGRLAIADLQMHVVFDEVVIEAGKPADPVSAGGDVDADEGRGTFKRFNLQDSWTWGEAHNRERPRFARGKEPPASFPATLTLADRREPAPRDAGAGRSPQALAAGKAALIFRTDMGRKAPVFGNSEGGTTLPEFQLEFEVPWRDLLAGNPIAIRLPYKGEWPEDTGTWTIVFRPGR